MKLNKIYTKAFLCILILSQCKKVETPIPFGKNYYPISLGATWFYQVDSITFNPFTENADTIHFKIKKEVTKLLTSPSGRTTYLIEQSSNNDSNIWYFEKYIEVYKDDYKIEERSNNKTFVKLVFPVKERKVWDGNQSNADDYKPYKFIGVNTKMNVNNVSYETIRVNQEFDSNFFQLIKLQEVYAKNVGLVKKINYKTEVQFNVREGYKVEWNLLDYKP